MKSHPSQFAPTEHVRGPSQASVTLIEYADYECSYCIMAYPVVEKVIRDRSKHLRYVFRHLPLTQLHPHALNAARAAEAAAQQGKFWEMHALLFRNAGRLRSEDLLSLAAELKLDSTRFESDLFSPTVTDRVSHDLDQAAESGVTGTPAFFINGERFTGDWRTDLGAACDEAN